MTLELCSPNEVVAPLGMEAVSRQSREERIKRWPWVGCDVQYAAVIAGRRKRGKGCESCRASYVVYGNHIDRVIDVRNKTELDAALDHAPEEVVSIGYCDIRVKCASIGRR
jgi:hypothetical protein